MYVLSGVHEPCRRWGRSVQLLYKMLCQPLSNELHKMPIYGQTLSKRGRGAKWLTIHKNLPTNCAQCMCSTSIGYTNELGKRKAAVVSLLLMKRTRSTSLASLPQEATKNMEVYKISDSPKKRLQAKTTMDRLHKNFRGRLVAHEMNSIHFSHSTYKILHLLLQQPSSI